MSKESFRPTNLTYTVSGSSGTCGHAHRSQRTARACLEKEQREGVALGNRLRVCRGDGTGLCSNCGDRGELRKNGQRLEFACCGADVLGFCGF
jgi:hypothetical protein